MDKFSALPIGVLGNVMLYCNKSDAFSLVQTNSAFYQAWTSVRYFWMSMHNPIMCLCSLCQHGNAKGVVKLIERMPDMQLDNYEALCVSAASGQLDAVKRLGQAALMCVMSRHGGLQQQAVRAQ